MKNAPETETKLEPETEMIELHHDGRSATGKALHLFGAGVLGGFLVVFGLGVLTPSLMCGHRCHGATVSQRQADAETRRRCLELGVTPEELAALDAAATSQGGE